MKILIDASCVMAVLLGEDSRAEIIRKTKGCQLVSASCLPFEIGNALSAAMKRKRISVEDALETFSQFKKIPVTLMDPVFEESIRWASEDNHYAYDMYYLSCAVAAGLPLLAFDEKLKYLAEKRGVKCL